MTFKRLYRKAAKEIQSQELLESWPLSKSSWLVKFKDHFENVKAGSSISLPPCRADSWARIPTQVMLAD